MIDVKNKNKKCIKCENKIPIFGFQEKKPTHCSSCKEPKMIDVIHSKCVKCNIKRPYYGFEGSNCCILSY
jgi:hypothetical protein